MSTEKSASIADDLRAAIEAQTRAGDEIDAAGKTQEADSDDEQETSASADDVAETGIVDDATPGGDASDDSASDDDNESGAAKDQPLEAPAHWPESDRSLFSELDHKGQKFLLRRHKEMDADYTRKTSELASLREFQPIAEMFAPHLPRLKAEGKSAADVVKELIAAQEYLTTDAPGAIKWLAQRYNVDFSALSKDDEEYVDPDVKALRKDLADIKQSVASQGQTFQQTQEQMAQRDWAAKVASFRDERNASGDPKHPHFDAVLDSMIERARFEVSQGRAPDLSKLYETAVWENTDTRAEMLAQRERAAATAARKTASAHAQKAASRDVQVDADAGGDTPEPDLPLREQIKRAMGA